MGRLRQGRWVGLLPSPQDLAVRRCSVALEDSHRAAALLLAWLFGCVAVFGQTPDRTFVESVDVEVIEVDVVVTDRKGRPVRGLGREDFELYADGERIEISNFAEFESILGGEMSLLRLPVDVAPSPKKARKKRSRDRSAATAGS